MDSRRAAACAAPLGALCLLLLAACGGGGASRPVATPFYVAHTSPLDGAFGVEVDPLVTVSFNTTLDMASVGAAALQVETGAGESIAGSLSVGHGGGYDSLRWFPDRALELATLYRVRLDPGLRSSAQDALAGSLQFTFVTTSGGAGDLPTADQLRRALGSLNVGRQGHTTSTLLDGRVLVVGGFTVGASTTDTAEIFLEGLEVFVPLEDTLALGRAAHTATVLADGRVLLAGGWIESGPGQNDTTGTAEIFNPVGNVFTPTGTMTTARADHAAALLPDGRVLVTGGSRLVGSFLEDLASAEVYDPSTGSWSALGESMTHTRATHGMVDNGLGRFVLCGGSDADPRHDWYDVATGQFKDLGMGTNDRGRFGPACAAFADGNVVIAGGDLLGTVMVVTPAGTVQNSGSGLYVPRSYATAVRIKPDQILVAGGIDFSRGGFIEASCDVVVQGGLGGANTFASAVRLGTGMAHHTATVLPSGDVLFCGGLNEDGAQPNKTDAFLFDVR